MAKLCEFTNMRKNGSRLISIQQYRITDLFIFAFMLAVAEVLSYFAVKWFPSGATFAFSFMIPITILVMLRWGWQAVFFPVISGTLYCALNRGAGYFYLIYIVGSLAIMLALIPIKLIGTKRIASTWWSTALIVCLGWLLVYLGRASVFAFVSLGGMTGYAPSVGFQSYAGADILSLGMAIVILLVLRKFNGMVEDQIEYLKRYGRERLDKMKRDEFGDELVEIDQEALDILNRDNNLYDE